MSRSGRAALVAVGALPVVLVVLARFSSGWPGVPRVAGTAVVDLTETVVALTAALTCALRALWRVRQPEVRRDPTSVPERRRREASGLTAGWTFLAAACLCWGVGQGAWSVDELLLHREPPTLGVPTIGYLAFPLLATAGVYHLGFRAGSALLRARSILDGVIVGGAFLMISWLTILAPIVAKGGASDLELATALAPPLEDLAFLAVVILLAARTQVTVPLVLLAGGMVVMALADARFVYVVALGSYVTGDLADIAWTVAFVMLAATPIAVTRSTAALRSTERRSSYVAGLMPYAPFGVATGLVFVALLEGPVDRVTIVVTAIVGLALLARQGVVVLDNIKLSRELTARSHQLHLMAYTDPLTGAANRLAFTERLAELTASGAPIVAAFCDLDSFKAVNDRCGHAVGDAVLVAVAQRLREVMRPQDVVARLGGDEFGVLVLDGGEGADDQGTDDLRDRLSTALSVPFTLPPRLSSAVSPEVVADVVNQVSASVGVVSTRELGPVDAETLLHAADARMYEMKRSRASAR